MNDFCELIELTESELDEVAGGRVSISDSFNRISVRLHLNIENNAQTQITNTVDNSMNF
jgi:hypothetical protein